MCTVSIISTADGAIRMACNRDELIARPHGLPPVVRRFGARLAAMPIDPAAGGTWIAVNDAGVVMALLNVNRGSVAAVGAGAISRGRIIPSLLHCASAREAVAEMRARELKIYNAFRLVLADRNEVFELSWKGEHLRSRRLETGARPMMFTSSGLGDELVERPRRELFQRWFGGGGVSAQRQDSFHQHRWEDRPHLSVWMSRADARTVSYSAIELKPDGATLWYQPNGPVDGSDTAMVHFP